MFVGDEIRVPVCAAAAATQLAALTGGGSLTGLSHTAWGDGIARVGPVPGISKLVQVQFLQQVRRGMVTVLTLRWEATGASGPLFPVLDADITLIPDGDQATLIGLEGVYRPPAGTIGATLDKHVMHRVAAATIRSLLRQIADEITRCALPASTLAPVTVGKA